MENTMMSKQPTVSFRDLWSLVLLVGIAMALVILALWMVISQYTLLPGRSSEQDLLGLSQTAFAEETGVKIVGVSLVMGRGMIDLRYEVVDPDKAVVVHDDEYPPGFMVESTGQIINTPYHEHAAFEAHVAVTYDEILMNPGGVLKRGDLVTVLIGQSRLEHVVVQ